MGAGRWLANRNRWLLLLPLVIYLVGLTYQVAEPWIGMHDWNGAFFSQLARNFLRYPWDLHHGMPVVAMGDGVPPPEERSLYATHPPGLVWLVALSFRLFGEHEWAARLVPIVASVGALWGLLFLVKRRWGLSAAVVSGLIYATMPMAVYYGRMVNHEPVCLFGMLAAMGCWAVVHDRAVGSVRRRMARTGFYLALLGLAWVDWSGVLFTGLFAMYAVLRWQQGRLGARELVGVVLAALVAVGGMTAYLVEVGLGGRWADLLAIFLSRVGSESQVPVGYAWAHFPENLSWPTLLLAAIGVIRWGSRPRLSPADDRGAGSEDATGREARVSFLGVPSLTGLIWLIIFWRQFAIHAYWAFYLGPVVAWLAASGWRGVQDWLPARQSAPGTVLSGLVLVGVLAGGVHGTRLLQAVKWYGGEPEVQVWQEIHQRTQSGDRILLYDDPIRIDLYGGYAFRNLTPPLLAYYLDRPVEVERDLRAAAGRAAGYACYVVPRDRAPVAGVAALSAEFRFEEIGTKLVFDFRRGECRGGGAARSGSP